MNLATPTGVWWVDLLIIAAMVVTAVGILWRKAIRPVARVLKKAIATLEATAQEFRPNGGGSMRDSADRTEKHLEELRAEVQELYEYAHEWRHVQSKKMEGLGLFDQALDRRIEDVRKIVETLPGKVDEAIAAQPPAKPEQ